jgi:hypothetical protein
MKHLKDFEKFKERLFDIFSSSEKNREEMNVSKRLKENDIVQIFETDPETKKQNDTTCFLIWKGEDGKQNNKVAKISLDKMNEYGKPIFKLTIFEGDKVKSTKFFLSQELATHQFLNYWESQTDEGRKKNKSYKIKKF